MIRSLVVLLAVAVVAPLSAQTRRPRPASFPLSVTISGAMNAYGTRAFLDSLPACSDVNCINFAFTRGLGVGAELQAPLMGTFGIAVGADGLTMLRQQCIPGGNCNTSGRVYGIRGRAQLLARLKARAPVYFGLGAAGMRVQPSTFSVQTEPTMDIGGVFTIGADFAAGERTFVRVAWHSFFLKTDNAGLVPTFQTGTSHDGVITVGARMLLRP
ncbi:MAG: hypothetical protein WD934_00970 [Gemmatimonadales bacterium]